jgi:hypothetical protein
LQNLSSSVVPHFESQRQRHLNFFGRSEARLLEQIDEFSDYVVDYNEMIALPRLIVYREWNETSSRQSSPIITAELREAILQAMPRITGLIRDKDHDTQSSAVTALSRLAEHGELRTQEDGVNDQPSQWSFMNYFARLCLKSWRCSKMRIMTLASQFFPNLLSMVSRASQGMMQLMDNERRTS